MNSGDVSNTTTTNSGEFLARGGGGDGDTIITDGVIGDSGCSPTLGGTSSDTRGGKPSGIGLRPIGQGGILTVAGGDVLGAPVAATKYGRAVAQTEVDTKGDSRWLADNESLVVTAFVAWVPVIKAQKFLVPVWPAQAARFSMTGWLSMCPYATPCRMAFHGRGGRRRVRVTAATNGHALFAKLKALDGLPTAPALLPNDESDGRSTHWDNPG
jgi:hypothetical protein